MLLHRLTSRFFSTLHKPQKNHYDIVIVGGGMIGTAVACKLGSSPITSSLRIALVEGSNPPKAMKEFSASSNNNITIPFHPRVSSITPGSATLLQSLPGVWGTLKRTERLGVYNNMIVWDGVGEGKVSFSASEIGLPQLGWIIENQIISSALWEYLNEQTSVDVFSATRITGLSDAGDSVSSSKILHLDDESELSARLVIGADGARSKVREYSGLRTVGYTYDQTAVTGTISLEKPTTTAWQRFLEHGPLALLPLPGQRATFVWSTTQSHADELISMNDDDFIAEINRALRATRGGATSSLDSISDLGSVLGPTLVQTSKVVGSVASTAASIAAGSPLTAIPNIIDSANALTSTLSSVFGADTPDSKKNEKNKNKSRSSNSNGNDNDESTGKESNIQGTERASTNNVIGSDDIPLVMSAESRRFGFPLRVNQGTNYVEPRIALIGDAAHSIHPLAGQGANLGFADIECLLEVLEEAVSTGQDLGSLSVLNQYELQRMPSNLAMALSVDLLQRLYSTSSPATALLRNIGMMAFNAATPLKSSVSEYAAKNQSPIDLLKLKL